MRMIGDATGVRDSRTGFTGTPNGSGTSSRGPRLRLIAAATLRWTGQMACAVRVPWRFRSSLMDAPSVTEQLHRAPSCELSRGGGFRRASEADTNPSRSFPAKVAPPYQSACGDNVGHRIQALLPFATASAYLIVRSTLPPITLPISSSENPRSFKTATKFGVLPMCSRPSGSFSPTLS